MNAQQGVTDQTMSLDHGLTLTKQSSNKHQQSIQRSTYRDLLELNDTLRLVCCFWLGDHVFIVIKQWTS